MQLLKSRRFMAEILPIRRNTLCNQSINTCISKIWNRENNELSTAYLCDSTVQGPFGDGVIILTFDQHLDVGVPLVT